MNPIQRLRDEKLVVIAGNGIYRIFKPAQEHEAADEFNFMGWSGDSPESNTTIKLSDRRGLLYFENNLWVFRVWDTTPGPGPEDFAFGYQSLDRAVRAVLDFYEGEPTSVADWLVPLNRHPYLDLEAVRHLIGEAKPITEAAFNDLKNDRSTKFAAEAKAQAMREGMTLEMPRAVMRLQFIDCPHRTRTRTTLRLRRDVAEAYIVSPDAGTSV